MDACESAPCNRHATIVAALNEVDGGAAFDIVNGHDPDPLYVQFEMEQPDSFSRGSSR
jgi:uncharacterized protein (DUF2249 family)